MSSTKDASTVARSPEAESCLRLHLLTEITRRFAATTSDYRQLLQTIVDEVGRFEDAYCVLGLVDDAGEHWEQVAEYVPNPEARAAMDHFIGPRRARLADTQIPALIAPGAPPFLQHAPLPEAFRARARPETIALMDRLVFRSIALVPLRLHGRALGTLSLLRFGADAAPLTEEDLDLLEVLADHAALTITNARLLEGVQRELREHRQTREALSKSEERLQQVQKMEAVGRLAGGIAHDFNNLMTVVLSYSDILLTALTSGAPLRDEVVEIRAAGERAADLTRQLLAYSRQQILSPQVLDLNEIVGRMERMLQRILGEDVVLRVRCADDLSRCKADPGQLEQVVMNLVVNARDAMPRGGRLTIETANATLDEAYVAEHPDAQVGPHVVLSVTDSGMGMDRAVMERIFEPFFTTKAPGTGTGLGLATVYGIVRQSGGNIYVYSEPGQGTTFKIYLPQASETVVAPAPADTTPTPHGTETVLVVEDDALVRRLVKRILVRGGYDVLEAASADEALRLYRATDQRIHLLLSDVVMPHTSGTQLAEQLLALRPGLTVLYMSGYTADAIVHHGVLESTVQFLPKPFTTDSLLRKVRTVLGRSSGPNDS